MCIYTVYRHINKNNLFKYMMFIMSYY